MIGIYKITSPNNRVYVGQSINIEKRFNEYRLLHCKEQPKLYNSFLKYNFNTHILEILEECEIEELNNRERYWQEFYDVLNGGLNCVLTQTELLPKIVSEDSKYKMGASNRGKIRSKEHSEKISISNKGRKLSKETKLKMSNSLKGKIVSDLVKLNMSKAQKGKIISEEQKQKLRDFNLGKKQSIETCLKKSLLFKGRECHKNTIESNSKKVIDTSTNIIYNSITEASKILNLNKSTLSYYLRGKRKNKTTLKYFNMSNNLTECPKCLSVGTLMEPKETKGFEYKKCSLCKGTGQVNSQIADDFVFAMNEDNFETNDDW